VGLWAGLDMFEKSLPIGIRSADRPARSQSLYRLSYRPTIGGVPVRYRMTTTGTLRLLTATSCYFNCNNRFIELQELLSVVSAGGTGQSV
jgi:hypothetical protein